MFWLSLKSRSAVSDLSEAAAAPEVDTYIKQFLTLSQYLDSPYRVCVNFLFDA